MKKILLLTALLFTYVISCNNATTEPNGGNTVENDIKTNIDGTKTYVLYTANINIGGGTTNRWVVRDGDYNMLERLWGATIQSYNGGMTVAYGPTYTAEIHKKGLRRAYLGYELNKTGIEAYHMYDKSDYDKYKKETIINEFKGVRIVRLPIERIDMDPTGDVLDDKLTIAGIYSNTGITYDLPQKTLQEMAIAFRQDCLTTVGDINIDGSIYYSMQFMFDRNKEKIRTAKEEFAPYEYMNNGSDYYNEHRKMNGWTFATRVNFEKPNK